jgi:hypothetical protein
MYPVALSSSYGAEVLPFPTITEALAKLALRIAQESHIALAQWSVDGDLQLASPAFKALQNTLSHDNWQEIHSRIKETQISGAGSACQIAIMLKGDW